ncbi:L-asparaginase [Herbaspirillum sp. alder98]|uniref:L-asparaginase n=1 Tax=Herbaspirillum sp. alder98 TaxID=2913096 RepID=UPI001CD8E7F3|nr:L-asparaginase [Herbaspirillum sp. alder98]MCA1326153.1 L-asparaginase [Herbaspirillum sp. alder98]
MKPLAPGTVIFHRHRGYGVIVLVNLMTGWISARFGSEVRTLDLNLSSDEVQHADGTPIMFRRAPPDRMPHVRLMAMVRLLHRAGYQRLYLYSWPKASGLHWRWHLFAGPRQWIERPWREGWYGSGADYNFNPIMGWGDNPGASAEELARALAQFDPQGLAQALGEDEEHAAWFEQVCATLAPDYAYSLGWDYHTGMPETLPIIGVRRNVPDYAGPPLPWPPGWHHLWKKSGQSPLLRYQPPTPGPLRITPEL